MGGNTTQKFWKQHYRFGDKTFVSFNRLIDISKNPRSVSIPINFLLPSIAETIPVVELPVNGSRITESGLVEARIILFSSSTGFCVGCFPKDFSAFFGG